jgi:hypothetical protein
VLIADPGARLPDVHEPSRALIVCAIVVLLAKVTAVPALTRTRAGEIAHGFDHGSWRLALRMLFTVSVPSVIVVTSSIRPSQSSTTGSAGGGVR